MASGGRGANGAQFKGLGTRQVTERERRSIWHNEEKAQEARRWPGTQERPSTLWEQRSARFATLAAAHCRRPSGVWFWRDGRAGCPAARGRAAGRTNNAFNRWAFDRIPFQTDTWPNPATGQTRPVPNGRTGRRSTPARAASSYRLSLRRALPAQGRRLQRRRRDAEDPRGEERQMRHVTLPARRPS